MAAENETSWIATAIAGVVAGVVLAIREFNKGRKEEALRPGGQHVIIEAGEIADLNEVRKLASELKSALEKLERIETVMDELKEKIDEMERAALVAKLVREEVKSLMGDHQRPRRDIE